jgi:hypothetical protein
MGKSGCDPNPCKNGGECVEIGDYGEYFCKCKKDFIESPTCEHSTYKSVHFIKKKKKSTIIYVLVLILNCILIISIITFIIMKKKFKNMKVIK